MINYKEFEVIRTILKNPMCCSADAIYQNKHYYVFKSVDEVKELMHVLEEKGYLADGKVTEEALSEISPLKVENAIILAAGASDISAKSVYSMPKGLFMKMVKR